MSLFERGFRFVLRAGKFDWIHSEDVAPSDLDCTDMTDDEFTAAVVANEAATKESTEGNTSK